MSIKDQKFGVAEKIMGFGGIKFQAIVGLAYPSLAKNNVTPVFDSLMQQK